MPTAKDHLYDLVTRVRLLAKTGQSRLPPFHGFAMSAEEKAEDQAKQTSEFARLFYSHKGRLIHKWAHYFDIYDRHLRSLRGSPVRMLEIGVSQGGSLEMWRRYFGSEATIFGIDIDPACADRVDPPNQVRIGSQADAAFLEGVVEEMQGVDLILDDGSHIASHQLISFATLFPRLEEGGLYIIEDTHTAYWPKFGGGLRRPLTAIEFAKSLIDDMHAWYHGEGSKTSAKDQIGAIHIYDSIIVIEKTSRNQPKHLKSR